MSLSLALASLHFKSPLGLGVAFASVILVILALWLVWRPVWQDWARTQNSQDVRASILSLQRHARLRSLKRRAAAFGSVFGAFIILFMGALVFFGGSYLAGVMFFCSGCMAMRAAWTLLRTQRSNLGQMG